MAVYPVGDAAADRTLCSSGRSADEEGEMVLADLQTLEFEALIAEEKCLVELHAALPLTLRSTEETVTIDKWLCFTQLLLFIEIAGEPKSHLNKPPIGGGEDYLDQREHST